MAEFEGIVPALESAHALAFVIRLASQRPSTERILVNLSGRGAKDADFVLEHYGADGSLAVSQNIVYYTRPLNSLGRYILINNMTSPYNDASPELYRS